MNEIFIEKTEGLHPAIAWTQFILFMCVANYGVWAFKDMNYILYAIGFIGAMLSIFTAKEMQDNRIVYLEKHKK